MNATVITTPPAQWLLGILDDVIQCNRDNVKKISATCQMFFDAERVHMLSKPPTDEDLKAHRTTVRYLLRVTRLLHYFAEDTDHPDSEIVSELRGRIIQLEHSQRQFQNPMPDAEADALLAKVFPE